MSALRKEKILIVDDEETIRDLLADSLTDEGYEVISCQNGEEALELLSKQNIAVVLLDIWMPGGFDGIQVLQKAQEIKHSAEFIMMSGHGNIETAVRATKLGAWDFVEKPLSLEKVFILIQNVLSFQEEKREKEDVINRFRDSIAIIGNSLSIKDIKSTLARMSSETGCILIQGDRGVGKSLIAQNTHYLSHRAGRPFIEVSCCALAEDLAEFDLFGFEQGAFSHIKKGSRGQLELSHGGTLVLDEFTALPMDVQLKLVEFLKTDEYQKAGGEDKTRVDVRVIATTGKNLEQEVRAGTVRQDLVDLLSKNFVAIPKLSERRDDVPALVIHFLGHFARTGGYRLKTITEEALQELKSCEWDGNIWELKNFVERLYIFVEKEIIGVDELTLAGFQKKGTEKIMSKNFKLARAQFEKEYIQNKLSKHKGDIAKTAKDIGLESRTLSHKIKTFNLDDMSLGE